MLKGGSIFCNNKKNEKKCFDETLNVFIVDVLHLPLSLALKNFFYSIKTAFTRTTAIVHALKQMNELTRSHSRINCRSLVATTKIRGHGHVTFSATFKSQCIIVHKQTENFIRNCSRKCD